jgi:glycerol-3-phosphate acyltransferase PlsX
LRIAVDALGGDNAPQAAVSGAVAAGKLSKDEVLLVGDEDTINPFLPKDVPPNMSTKEASGVIGMEEEPASALRSRPDLSVAVCARVVSEGEADAFFSAGNTGATVAAALLYMGRLKGCRRPGIATYLPFSSPVILIDAGATVSCRAQDLLNFAILGTVFARRYMGLERVRVALINVGEEAGKGGELAKEAYALLEECSQIEFVGNAEGTDIAAGKADVLVTDGFTGNVVLKTAEGVSKELMSVIRASITGGPVSKLAAGVLRPKLMAVHERVDPERYGGSFLLGVKAPVVIGHGNSRAPGIENAISGISRVGEGMVEEMEDALAVGGKV